MFVLVLLKEINLLQRCCELFKGKGEKRKKNYRIGNIYVAFNTAECRSMRCWEANAAH